MQQRTATTHRRLVATRRRLTGLAVLALACTAILPRFGHAQEKPPAKNLDDVEYDQVIERGALLDADKILQVWASRLGVLIMVDPQMAGVKIKFLQSDVKLTWGLFKKVLDFYDVVLDEKEVNGRWVMFAHLRRNLPQRAGPPFPVFNEKDPANGGKQIEELLPRREEIVTAVIQIQNGAGNDIFATVRGLLVRDVNRIGNILYVRGPEVMIIVDYASNVDYYVKIIRALDVQAPGQVTKVIQINFAPADDIVRVIQTLLRPQGGPGGGAVPVGVPGAGGAGQTPPNLISDPRTNKIIAQAYPYQFDEIDRMIRELDVRAPQRPPTFHFYKCKNVDAPYLAGKLGELFGTGGGGGTTRQRGSARQSNRPGQAGAAPPPAPAPTFVNQGGGATGQKGDFSAIDTRIVADELSNSLLIQAEDPIYRQILAILEGNAENPGGLDRARRRVMIEAQIWEISTPNDNMTIGFELAGVNNAHNGSYRPSAATSFGLSQLAFDPQRQIITRIPNPTPGVLGVLTKDTFDKLPVIVQAIASLENSRLVTTPFALTNDNTEALFEINNKIPFTTQTLTTGFSAGNVQFIDVKTSLTVTPQVNSSDNLTLQIEVQLSSAGAQGSPNVPPTTNERHYKGEVTVPNMRYVVFGGLESETFGSVEQKVPFLGDIPILGHLFKTKTWSHSKNKVYIFVRPTIFQDEKGITAASEALRERVHVEAEREEWVPPIIAERYVTAPWKTTQDQIFDVFGTGSGNPFSTQPKDE